MRSRKIILSMAMAGVLLTGCASVNNQNEVAGQTPEITIEATEAETETEGKVVMSKEQTDEFIMNRIWEESWLKGYYTRILKCHIITIRDITMIFVR